MRDGSTAVKATRGCSPCTQCLHLSEHAAYGRIEAARAARRWPIILELLSEGAVTLTTVCLLASHLTNENHRVVLDATRHKSKRDVEEQVAALRPLAPVPSSVRKVPTRQPCGTSDDGPGRISGRTRPVRTVASSRIREVRCQARSTRSGPDRVARHSPTSIRSNSQSST